MSKLILYWQLMRFDKPIGILLLFFPVSWALLLAYHNHPPLTLVGIFTLGVVLTRAAGCIVNDMCDRDIDVRVARTRNRPLATGALSMQEASFALVALIGCLLGLLLCLNMRVIPWAIAAAALTVLYPLSKRFFAFPQSILGITFNMGVLMVFVQAEALSLTAWLLYAASVLWTFSYDTVYALADQADDARIGVRSSALSLGRYLDWALCVGYGSMFMLLGIILQQIIIGLVCAALFVALYPRILKPWITHAPIAFFKGNAWLGLMMTIFIFSS